MAAGSLSFHLLTAPLLTAFVIAVPTLWLPSRLRAVVQWLLGAMVMVVCLVDVYCQVVIGTPITPQVYLTILQSNVRESTEFLSVFVTSEVLTSWRVLGVLVLMVLFTAALWTKTGRRCERFLTHIPRRGLVYGALFVLCLACEASSVGKYGQLFRSNQDMLQREGLIFRHYHEEVPTPLHRMAFAVYVTQLAADDLIKIKRSTFAADVDSCSFRSPHIVLVIGESYNKHHSMLYGYPLPTTPLQAKRRDAGELFVFEDVVTPWNITSNVFLDMFSMWEVGDERRMSECPLLPMLFRRAGYQVTFFSNQYLLRRRRGSTNQAGYFFLADKELSDSLFDHRNRRSEKYDMDLVGQVEEYVGARRADAYTLDIVHLIGQHFDYGRRYPRGAARFTKKNYADRQLSADALQTVVDYDNATCYDDMVLDSLLRLYEPTETVVVFVADHGEEVYDDLPVQGRLYQTPTAAQVHHEFEVPMWIWCSESYRAHHKELVEQMASSVHKPFMTDGMGQLMLHLAGISSRWNRNEHNLLSSDYRCKPRMVGGEADYDVLIGRE